jgi:hypothetical protein
MIRVAGDQLGVQFLAQDKTKKKLLKRQPPANETA